MAKQQIYTKPEHDDLFEKGDALLQRHKYVMRQTQKRLLSKADETFLAGCKKNYNGGEQGELSGKQLKRISVLIERMASVKIPKKKIVKTPLPTKRELSPDQQRLKELVTTGLAKQDNLKDI